MQIEIKECCGIHGEIVEKGDVIEVDDPTAKMLVAIGKAQPFNPEEETDLGSEEEAGDDPEAEPEGEIEHQDPAPTHRDPQPKRKR